jgi:hypothetical protein
MADADEPRPPTTCPGCGRARGTSDAAAVTWSSRHTPDGVEFVCPDCTRADLRLIEAGLPPS